VKEKGETVMEEEEGWVRAGKEEVKGGVKGEEMVVEMAEAG